ncbi:hypothetical protein BDP27DRAFT_420864 [Rhodocollybia butyracea]|uniref:C3H1-type domain-containing protein n=1 Tax=Rhodocollybia butyracea TaxID=206335 RepID=A0A9P5TZM2_9AGAR|nr:hypothetical protein BDP27DRAFT_420864 [Rhodocollybia butyracea]
MEISWRRLLVTLEIGPEIDESTLPKRRKCISVPHTSTNADLREEVAKTFNVDRISVSLEVNGGFELREQDSIMTLREDEVITAKLVASDETGNGPSSSLKRKVPTPPKPTVVATRTPDKTMHKGNGRRILFVTPEMARRFANAHPNSVDEPSTEDFGIFAFRGTLVDDRVTLGALKREAAQLLGLAVDPESMDNDGCTECQPNADETCACTIANEIQAHGLLSSMHCRLSIDGSVCSNGIDCPYSHSRTLGPNKKESPRCTLCDEHLANTYTAQSSLTPDVNIYITRIV